MNKSQVLIKRLCAYLHYLRQLPPEVTTVSATAIAYELGYGDVQVRKDLAAVAGGGGRPKTGYPVRMLTSQLVRYLGFDRKTEAVIVGAGRLGMALYEYGGFSEYGIEIVAAFDKDPGKCDASKGVYPYGCLADFCGKENIEIGIITVPAEQAQPVCDLLTGCGVRSIWNFSAAYLRHSESVTVFNENMAASLAALLINKSE